ncbi:hypothetical protein [Pantoea stewartii]|uniref:hypothetical protein n=1 Tax=Pantoea stewartii TaxID=66269 RepID=UPI0006D06AF1|nr:hypothetical protein [Pantoea stewartii]
MIAKAYKRHLVVVFILLLIAFWVGNSFTYSDIKDILSTLQNISAMIFTIAGIWLAYIYPKAISVMMKPSILSDEIKPNSDGEIVRPELKITNEQKEAMLKDVDRITLIVEAIVVSALVLLSILLINVIKPIFSNLAIVKNHIETFSEIGCFFTLTLVYFQIVSLISILISNAIFINDIHNEKNKKELNELK